jgi:hypothetical protein
MRHINVPDLLDVPDGTEVAWWIGHASFAASLTAVGRYPDEVRWQPIRHVEDDDAHVIVTTDSGESTISKQLGVVVRRGDLAVKLSRVLKDIDMGRVGLNADDTIRTVGVFVDPARKPDYDETVRVLLDASWAMELRPGGMHTGLLRLTTIGEIKLIQGAEAVTV